MEIAEPSAEIRHDLPRRRFYDLKYLPPVTAACAFSSSDDAVAEKAYRAINMWMSIRGFSLAGPSAKFISTHPGNSVPAEIRLKELGVHPSALIQP